MLTLLATDEPMLPKSFITDLPVLKAELTAPPTVPIRPVNALAADSLDLKPELKFWTALIPGSNAVRTLPPSDPIDPLNALAAAWVSLKPALKLLTWLIAGLKADETVLPIVVKGLHLSPPQARSAVPRRTR